MLFTIIIAIISLIGLLIIHELGHFILAKKFGVRVEEFGLGYPPKLFGKRIGQTIYSLNLLPFGAFVRIFGEESQLKEPQSFFSKPIWQRALIIFGGVASFWIIAVTLLSFVMAIGAPTAVSDEANGDLINPKVQIVSVSPDSPAEIANLKVGDTIKQLTINPEGKQSSYGTGNQPLAITKVAQVQDFTEKYKGKEIILTVERGKETFTSELTPRSDPPKGQGPLGVALMRTAIKSYPWYQAPFKGIIATANLTVLIVKGFGSAIVKAIAKEPTGVQLMGPVGVFGLFTQMSQLGLVYFLQFIAVIAVHLAILNLLPVPALDGGKLMFLAIEKIKGRPVKESIEKTITGIFFALLIALMILITIRDVVRLF